MQIVESREVHDVIIIGSGASGGMAAYNLTQKGVKVLMLDAGGKFELTKFWTHAVPFEADERLRHGEKPPPFFLDKTEQPYLTPEGKPFNLMRRRAHACRAHPARQHHAPASRLRRMPLLRQLRRWLRHRLVLQLSRSSDSLRARDRESRDSVASRRGAHPNRRSRPSFGCPIF